MGEKIIKITAYYCSRAAGPDPQGSEWNPHPIRTCKNRSRKCPQASKKIQDNCAQPARQKRILWSEFPVASTPDS